MTALSNLIPFSRSKNPPKKPTVEPAAKGPLKAKPQPANKKIVKSPDKRGINHHSTQSDAILLSHLGVSRIQAGTLLKLLAESKVRPSKIDADDSYIYLHVPVFDKPNEVEHVRIERSILDAIHIAGRAGVSDELLERIEKNPYVFESLDPISLRRLTLNKAVWQASGVRQPGLDMWRALDVANMAQPAKMFSQRAQYANAAGVLDEQTIEDFRMSIAYSVPPSPAIVFSAFKYIWKVEGTSYEARDAILSILHDPKISINQLMTAASFFCDSGEYERSIDIALIAKRKDKDAWNKFRFLGLTHLLVEEGLLRSQWAINDASILDHIRANEGCFEQMVKENRDSLAFVGNSPNQIGLGAGKRIDEKEVVVRFNSAPLAHKHAADYGWKHDVWVTNGRHYDVRRQQIRRDVKLVVMSGSNLIYWNANSFAKFRDFVKYYQVQVVPDQPLRDTIAETKSNPSSGLVTLNWVSSLLGNLRDQEHVFGFSLTDQKSRTTAHYYEKGLQAARHQHDWDAERELFDKLVSPTENDGTAF